MNERRSVFGAKSQFHRKSQVLSRKTTRVHEYAATAESAFAPFVALELASIEAAGVFLS
jgi:hypothetical protein